MSKLSYQKKRLHYAFLCVILIAIEILIALFVHDRILRPYGGDVIIVIVIYCFLRVFFPKKPKLLAFYVFLFAAVVEVLQFFDYVALLGLSGNRFLSILLGSSFSFVDILCYAIGCLLCFLIDKQGKR